MFVVDDEMVLLTGNVIRLGNGDHYIYHGPKVGSQPLLHASMELTVAISSFPIFTRRNRSFVTVLTLIPASRKYRGCATRVTSSPKKSLIVI